MTAGAREKMTLHIASRKGVSLERLVRNMRPGDMADYHDQAKYLQTQPMLRKRLSSALLGPGREPAGGP